MEKLMSRLVDIERRLPPAASPASSEGAPRQRLVADQPPRVPAIDLAPAPLASATEASQLVLQPSSAPVVAAGPAILQAVVAPRFTQSRLERSILCVPCREKVVSGVVQEDVMKELLQCWFEGTFEPCSTGMSRRTLLDAHLNPFLADLGLRTLDLQHPAWNLFLREAVGMSEEKIKAGRSMVKVQPRPRKAALTVAVSAWLKKLTEQ